MKKKWASIILLLVLGSLMVTLPNVGIVKAQNTIYIRADGSIEGTGKIQRNGNTYTVTGDIDGGVVVEKDGIILDGAGYVVRGTGVEHSSGISLKVRSNITVSNFRIESFYYGVIMLPNYISLGVPDGESSNNMITENTITGCTIGITLFESSNNNIIGNTLKNSTYGIQIVESSYNVIDFGYNNVSENNITNNINGIWIERSSNNTIFGNTIINNSDIGIFLNGAGYNNIIGNNITKNGRGILVTILISYNNIIHHNNFVNNTDHVETDDSHDIWDNGFEGNYWSDYNGIDNNGDGIGDTSYIIDENNQDNYPLMNPVDISLIPEFPSWIILPLFLVVTLLAIVLKKKLSWI